MAKAANKAPAMKQESWTDLLSQLDTASSFYRPKEGKSRIRIVLPEGTELPEEEGAAIKFFGEVTTTFRGKEKTRFIIPALVLDGPGARPEMATKVTPVLISKSVLKGIIGLLAEGYDLFSEEEGYGITLQRTGQGLDTNYSVMPSKNPIPLPEDFERSEESLDEMATKFEEWAASRGNSSEGEEDGDAAEDLVRSSKSGKRQQKEDW